jgi:hypothetical protein
MPEEIIWWSGVCYIPGDGELTTEYSPPMESPVLAWEEAIKLREIHDSDLIGIVPRYPEQLTGKQVPKDSFGH